MIDTARLVAILRLVEKIKTDLGDIETEAKQAIKLAERRHHEHRVPFHEDQRIRYKNGGWMGRFCFHNGHPAVRWDGESYPSGIEIDQWEAA